MLSLLCDRCNEIILMHDILMICLSSIIVNKIPNNSGMSGRAIVNLNQYDTG